MKQSNLCHLWTERGKKLSGTPWNVYPRPRLVRDSFLCLNGEWDFSIASEPPAEYTDKILVPYPPESLLSGINKTHKKREQLFYRRFFTLPPGFRNDIVLLHIGACSLTCDIYINGQLAGRHTGGFDAFSLDITPFISEGENELRITVSDRNPSLALPYGKSREKRGGMWYTPVSGIWQTVWLESVPKEYIKDIKIDSGSNFANITVDGVSDGDITVTTPEGDLCLRLENGRASVKIDNPLMWSPENPYLYRFTVAAKSDTVSSYFALRTLDIKTVNGLPRLCLNGKPYFFNGLLDQGYFSDGIYTPASPECFEDDILTLKAMGFNMLRKHIKVEPQLFYYACDRLGMAVFQDMVNNGRYSFLWDTALPTVGFKRANDRIKHTNKRVRSGFIECMEKTVGQLSSHPSICYWTIFNEGWGQFCSTDMYHRLKAIDPTRFIDSASGWFTGGKSDVVSPHIYFKKIDLKPQDKPTVLSEFGGYSYKPEGHAFNADKTFGYRFFNNAEEYADAVEHLYLDQIVPAVRNGVCGTVYTQVSDVEDETNGLLSYDRKVQKIETERMAVISKKLFEAFHKTL